MRNNENVSVVVEAKEKGTKEIHIAFRQVFVIKRIKRVVQPPNRQKVR